MEIAENIVGKGDDADYQHFLLFPQSFQKASLSGSLKGGILCKRINQVKYAFIIVRKLVWLDKCSHFEMKSPCSKLFPFQIEVKPNTQVNEVETTKRSLKVRQKFIIRLHA